MRASHRFRDLHWPYGFFNPADEDINRVALLRCSLLKNLCDESFIRTAVTFGIDPGNFHFVANLTAFELE